MPLESLQPDSRPSVRRVSSEALEREKESHAWVELLKLKEKGFYDSERGLWKPGADENKEAEIRNTEDQLIGDIILGTYDPEKAAREMKKFKKKMGYNEETGLWPRYEVFKGAIKKEPEWARDPITSDQLWSVFLEAQFDKKKAQEKIDKLKENSKFYSEDREEWWGHGDTLQLKMLGILNQSLFDVEAAKKEYKKLQKSYFGYSTKILWRPQLDPGLGGYEYQTNHQLLGILLDTQFNPKIAKQRFKKLKKSGFFFNGGWIKKRGHAVHTIQLTSNQLLGVLAERMIELKEGKEKEEQIPPIPQIKE